MGNDDDPIFAAELRELFDRAIELAGEVREAFVREQCRARPELEAALRRLIEHHETLGTFLAAPVAARRPLGETPAPLSGLLLRPGDELGGYDIDDYLGGGGGGQVYRARQRSLGGREVALKVVCARNVTASDRERFLRGARMAAAIDHPHLAQVYECGEDVERELLYYSMRLVRGPTCQELLARSPPSQRQAPDALRILACRATEVAEALGALHAHGLIHQDVKPGNVMIEGASDDRPWEGSAVLVDFGLVKRVDSSGPLSTVWATLPYAAPEVLLNHRAEASSDVYSLGLCLYDVLTGQQSTRSGSGDELARLASVVPAIDADLEAIVHRAIETRPERRYANGSALALDLRAWLDGRPIEARRLTPLERARRWVRRHAEGVVHFGSRAAGFLLLGALSMAGWKQWTTWKRVAEAAERSREDGRLVALRQAVVQLPALPERWLLSTETERLVARFEKEQDGLARVTARGLEAGLPEALLLATRHLDRDGLRAEPELAHFLLSPLKAGGLDAERALTLAALLLHDRPCETPDELAAARPFRAAFTAALRGADPLGSAVRLYCLTGLAGCGDLSSIEEILAFIERDTDQEAFRLGAIALEMIARRSFDCGFSRALLEGPWASWLTRLCAKRRVDLSLKRDWVFFDPLDNLSRYVASRRVAAGLGPFSSEFCSSSTPARLAFAIANGSEHALVDLRTWLATDESSLHGHLLAGEWLAYSPEVERARTVFDDLVEAAIARHDPRAKVALEENYHDTRKDLVRWPDGWRSDPDARLHCGLLTPVIGTCPPAKPLDERGRHPKSIAFWHFEADGTCGQSGSAISVVLSAAAVKPDDPEGYFACLGVPGVSEARFRFRHEFGEPKLPLVLRILCQKGTRKALPHGGDAPASVRVQDSASEFSAYESEVHYTQALDLRRIEPSAEYEFVVSLSPEATTTFRIYEVDIYVD